MGPQERIKKEVETTEIIRGRRITIYVSQATAADWRSDADINGLPIRGSGKSEDLAREDCIRRIEEYFHVHPPISKSHAALVALAATLGIAFAALMVVWILATTSKIDAGFLYEKAGLTVSATGVLGAYLLLYYAMIHGFRSVLNLIASTLVIAVVASTALLTFQDRVVPVNGTWQQAAIPGEIANKLAELMQQSELSKQEILSLKAQNHRLQNQIDEIEQSQKDIEQAAQEIKIWIDGEPQSKEPTRQQMLRLFELLKKHGRTSATRP